MERKNGRMKENKKERGLRHRQHSKTKQLKQKKRGVKKKTCVSRSTIMAHLESMRTQALRISCTSLIGVTAGH